MEDHSVALMGWGDSIEHYDTAAYPMATDRSMEVRQCLYF